MGPKLRNLIEQQLLEDLLHYGFVNKELRFNWTAGCLEGKSAKYLDGSLENFSGIALYDDEQNALVAEGWMEFILAGDFFLVYWDNLTTWKNGERIASKEYFGIPPHVWKKIPSYVRDSYEKEKLK